MRYDTEVINTFEVAMSKESVISKTTKAELHTCKQSKHFIWSPKQSIVPRDISSSARDITKLCQGWRNHLICLCLRSPRILALKFISTLLSFLLFQIISQGMSQGNSRDPLSELSLGNNMVGLSALNMSLNAAFQPHQRGMWCYMPLGLKT